jgi:hypothetical protein
VLPRIRYLFAALGSATVLPAVDEIGVGWFSTISAAFLVASSLATLAAVLWGRAWREKIDRKRRIKRGKMLEEKNESKIKPVMVDGGKEKEMV